MPADYYQILGIEPDADAKSIKEAYRKLALRYHPDRNRDDATAAAHMKEINEAYAVLSHPDKRRQYDQMRTMHHEGASDYFRQTYSQQDIFRDSDIFQFFEEISRRAGMRGFEESFKDVYGKGFQGFVVHIGGVNDKSGFLGNLMGSMLSRGLNNIFGFNLPVRGKDREEALMVSRTMAREGGQLLYHSRDQKKDVMVTVPAGTGGGNRIRLKGMGGTGTGGAENGDLCLTVVIAPDWLAKGAYALGVAARQSVPLGIKTCKTVREQWIPRLKEGLQTVKKQFSEPLFPEKSGQSPQPLSDDPPKASFHETPEGVKKADRPASSKTPDPHQLPMSTLERALKNAHEDLLPRLRAGVRKAWAQMLPHLAQSFRTIRANLLPQLRKGFQATRTRMVPALRDLAEQLRAWWRKWGKP